MKVCPLFSSFLFFLHPTHHSAVIHLCLTTSAGIAQLPYVLSSRHPPPETRVPEADDVATLNYSHPPQAIIFGQSFTDEDIEKTREVCGELMEEVIWVKVDQSREHPDPQSDLQGYGRHMVKRARETLARIVGGKIRKGEVVAY